MTISTTYPFYFTDITSTAYPYGIPPEDSVGFVTSTIDQPDPDRIKKAQRLARLEEFKRRLPSYRKARNASKKKIKEAKRKHRNK